MTKHPPSSGAACPTTEAFGDAGGGGDGRLVRRSGQDAQASPSHGGPHAGSKTDIVEQTAAPAHRDGRVKAKLAGRIDHQLGQGLLSGSDNPSRDG